MATNYIQDGRILKVTNGTGDTVSAGGGILVGARVGVALDDIADGAVGQVQVDGVFEVAKDTGVGTGGAQGADAYWDATAGAFTAVSTDNTLAGYFAATCIDAATVCSVALNR